jgi:hypothetical protein
LLFYLTQAVVPCNHHKLSVTVRNASPAQGVRGVAGQR